MTRRHRNRPQSATPRTVSRKQQSKSPQQSAREQARKCYQEILRREGSVQEGVRAYHCIGQALRNLISGGHKSRYGQNRAGVFIEEWQLQGGFRFGPGQGKYFRVFADAFDDKLLDDAVSAKLSWTALRELSGSEVNVKDRRSIVRRVLRNKLAPSKVIAEVRAITGASHKAPRNLRARSAKKMPAILSRHLAALIRSMKRLDSAMDNLQDTKRFKTKDAIIFCKRVINLGKLAGRCGLQWDNRADRAREEIVVAQGKTGKK